MIIFQYLKYFILEQIFGSLLFFIPILFFSLLFSSGFVYLGQDTSSLFSLVIRSQPLLVFTCLLNVLGVTFSLCFLLQMFSLSLKKRTRLLFGFLFFSFSFLRVFSLYPALTEKWFLIHQFPTFRKFVEYLCLLPLNSPARHFLNLFPLLLCLLFFVLSFFNQLKMWVHSRDPVFKFGFRFIPFLIIGVFFLPKFSGALSLHIPKNDTKQSQPNIFIFASDSLRYDRFTEEKYKDVMPYLKSQVEKSLFFHPMVVGIPRTFPSWVEIGSGNYSLKTGIRTMFPSRSARLNGAKTIFQLAKENGYSTIFVSDFAGDIFPRYPFGASLVDAPSSNLRTLVENGMISFFSPLQSVLVFPYWQRVLPSLLESPEISDPRLVASALAKNLAKVAKKNHPVLMTAFFSSAHFPYASPGPWVGKFQSKQTHIPLQFQKIPDQVLNKNEPYKLNHPSDEVKDQTIALYNGGLNAIDNTLEELIEQLNEKGWLKNSLIFIFGDHGENLYDGDMGMGHGDGVQGEFSTVTPLLVLGQGEVAKNTIAVTPKQLVRTIDLAPTIAHVLKLPFEFENSDGVSLFQPSTQSAEFPKDRAYMETGIWFTTGLRTPENQPRIIYPGVVALLDIDPYFHFEFYLRPDYYQSIPGVKERAWLDASYKLIVRTTKAGAQLYLYTRDDWQAENNLLEKPEYKPIAIRMLKELNTYLQSRGVEIIPCQNGSFFYAENIVQ